MRYQIEDFNYNPKTHVSTMIASSKYGKLFASIKCNPADYDIENHWDAFDFCKYKITLQYMKLRCIELQNRANAVFDATKTVYLNMNYLDPNWDDKIKMLLLVDKQGYGYTKTYEVEYQKYLDLKNNYKQYCKDALDFRRNLRNKVAHKREE